MIATLFLAALRSWCRRDRTWRKAARTAAATAGLLAAYAAVPMAALWFYATCFAPMNFFLWEMPGYPLRYSIEASPNGEFATFNARYLGWGFGVRAALVGAESGRTKWLTRFRCSVIWPEFSERAWSPSGERCILVKEDFLLMPFQPRASAMAAQLSSWIVDARTGEQHSFHEFCPSLLRPVWLLAVGWCSETVVAFEYGRAFSFADIEHHKVYECKTPETWHERSADYDTILPQWSPLTQRGVFSGLQLGWDGKIWKAYVFRYAPDLPEAETLRLLNGPNVLDRISGSMRASSDGQYLLLTTNENRQARYNENRQARYWGPRYCYLAQAVNGADCIPLISEHKDDKALISSSWHASGFVPGTHQVLLFRDEAPGLHVVDKEELKGSGAEVGLFDADSHELRRIPLPETTGLQIDSVELSPRGGFVLVRIANPLKVGKPGAFLRNDVCDLKSGASWVVHEAWSEDLRWMGEDHLLALVNDLPVIMNRDGAGERPLLK